MHTYLTYLSLLFKTTFLNCTKMLSVLFGLSYKHLHKLILGGLFLFRKVFYQMKDSISFKVSCYIPFPLEGLGQTIRPPHDQALMLVAACRDFLMLFKVGIRLFFFCHISSFGQLLFQNAASWK